jgi:hypothetical protein
MSVSSEKNTKDVKDLCIYESCKLFTRAEDEAMRTVRKLFAYREHACEHDGVRRYALDVVCSNFLCDLLCSQLASVACVVVRIPVGANTEPYAVVLNFAPAVELSVGRIEEELALAVELDRTALTGKRVLIGARGTKDEIIVRHDGWLEVRLNLLVCA